MRRHYIIDTSALVPFFVQIKPHDNKIRSSILKLLELQEDKKAFLFIPNVCMAECSKALAGIAYGKYPHNYEKGCDTHARYVDTLLDLVSTRKKGLIRTLATKREHFVNIEEIFQLEYRMEEREPKTLSGLDALIINRAKYHAKSSGAGLEKVYIVTMDTGIRAVCKSFPTILPRAIDLLKDQIPDG